MRERGFAVHADATAERVFGDGAVQVRRRCDEDGVGRCGFEEFGVCGVAVGVTGAAFGGGEAAGLCVAQADELDVFEGGEFGDDGSALPAAPDDADRERSREPAEAFCEDGGDGGNAQHAAGEADRGFDEAATVDGHWSQSLLVCQRCSVW